MTEQQAFAFFGGLKPFASTEKTKTKILRGQYPEKRD